MSVGVQSSLTVVGTIQDQPVSGNPSGTPTATIAINEAWLLAHPGVIANFDLTADPAQAVSFEGLPGGEATHVFVRVTGGHCDVTLTSAAGVAQVVPANPLGLWVSVDQPFTAMSIQRPAGVEVSVQVYLANGS